MSSLLRPSLANNLWKMHVVRLFFWMHFMSSVLVPFFRDWGGISYTQIFTLNAWFMFCNFLLEVPTGTIADVFGRRTSLILGCLAAVVGWLTYSSIPDFRVFLVGEVLLATSMTLISGADEALIYDSLDQLGRRDEAQRIFGRLESAKLAGIIIGALAGGFIAATFGLRAPMLAQCIPNLIAAATAFSLKEPPRPRATRSLEAYRRTLGAGLRHLRDHRTLRVLAADMVTAATLAWLIIWLYQPQLERVGIGMRYFGLVHGAMCAGQILLLSNIDRVAAFLGSQRRYLFLSAIAPGFAYLALGLSNHLPVVVAAIVGAAAFGLSRPAVFMAHMNASIPSEQRATVLSSISMLRTLAVAVANPLAGWLVDWSMQGALITLGIVALVVATVSRVEEAHLVAH
ncbi:MAG: MFS transporter [Deltaproteobacteria bacterium]|nr:MFS transporter [Deltaproteobacteria bacterium]